MRVETNEGDISDLESDIEDNDEAIGELTTTVENNGVAIIDLDGDIGDLQSDVDLAASAALIEDFFTTNELLLEFPNGDVNDLIEFCVGPGVLIFQIIYNPFSDDDNTRTPNLETMLFIDGVVVADSLVFDRQEPNNIALFYEGVITEETEVKVTINSSGRSYGIEPLNLQWGYKLYGSGYNLISETNDDCISV